MYKNRIRGGAERGERANDREAALTKAQATFGPLCRLRAGATRAVYRDIVGWLVA
jgi:hypothetical protein